MLLSGAGGRSGNRKATVELGDSFDLIKAAGGVSGTFATVLANLDPRLNVRVAYGAADVSLSVVPMLAGDYNADGIVNATDYVAWRDARGSTTDLVADGSGNGVVDHADYIVWKANFGNRLTTVTVPEPANWLLVLAALPFVTRRTTIRILR